MQLPYTETISSYTRLWGRLFRVAGWRQGLFDTIVGSRVVEEGDLLFEKEIAIICHLRISGGASELR